MFSKIKISREDDFASGGPPMEHFTVDQMCKHGGCEMAIRFVISADSLATPACPAGTINTYVCPTRQPTQTMYDSLCLLRRALPPSLDTLQNVFAIFVQLQLRDNDLGGVNADRHRLTR